MQMEISKTWVQSYVDTVYADLYREYNIKPGKQFTPEQLESIAKATKVINKFLATKTVYYNGIRPYASERGEKPNGVNYTPICSLNIQSLLVADKSKVKLMPKASLADILYFEMNKKASIIKRKFSKRQKEIKRVYEKQRRNAGMPMSNQDIVKADLHQQLSGTAGWTPEGVDFSGFSL